MSILNKRELSSIKKSLPAGWGDKISEETGLSYSTVLKTLRNERNNPSVIKAAINLADLPETRKTEFLQKLEPFTA